MGWLFMLVCAAATALFFNIEPRMAFYIAFLILAANFASFCLLYDVPINRARERISQQMSQMSSTGIQANEYQRLQSMKAVATDDDKRFRWTLMSSANFVTGIAGGVMLIWAIIARMT